MQYKRLLCCVEKLQRKQIREALQKRGPCMCVRNIETLVKNVKHTDLVVISNRFAEYAHTYFYITKCNEQATYVFLTNPGENIFNQKLRQIPNAIKGIYNAGDIVNHYLGNIPDLWTMVHNKYFAEDTI